MKSEGVEQTTVELIPTRHFERRFLERSAFVQSAQETLPMMRQSERVSVSGSLVKGKDAGEYYLEVEGASRFVLKQKRATFIGITVLPSRGAHTPNGGDCCV